jgi:hypothetical protein
MERPGEAMIRRALARVRTHGDTAPTVATLIRQCEADVRYSGRDTTRHLYLPGEMGKSLRKTRRLFPGGPVGIVCWQVGEDRLYVEFRSLDILLSLSAISEASGAVFSSLNDRFPYELPPDQAKAFAEAVTPIKLSPALLNEAYVDSRGKSISLCRALLIVEAAAIERGWSRVTAEKWAGRRFW